MSLLMRFLLKDRTSYMRHIRFRKRIYRISIEPYVPVGRIKEDLAVMPGKDK